ncbi:ABC transporter substrate-binding protein [Bacillus salitolerans]|uniref:ABC transporter substrate-binding protein n=1 Tax=Bacillus salitolerans TaxID=1437434 RepID=A0ABW4LRF7_9BACI
MNSDYYYIKIRKHFSSYRIGESFTVRMDDLLEVMECTRRNVQLQFNKMKEKGLIEWSPGKGRGNPSSLTFLQPVQDLVIDRAKQFVLKGHIDEAWKLIDTHDIGAVKFEFSEWLYRHIGFQQVDNDMDTLRLPFYRPVLELDPTFVHRRTEAHLVNQVFNTLVTYDERTEEITSQLSYFWECNHTKTKWRFYIRKGVKFHHGKVLTTEDVEFTFNRIINESHFDEIRRTIKNIEKISTTIIEFTLNEPNVLFLHYLCNVRCSIIPKDYMDLNTSHPFTVQPVGSGPFKMVENNDSILVLEAHDHYFEGRPHLDRIEMWVWPNYQEQKVLRRLEQDDIYYGELPVSRETYTQVENIEQGCTYLTFNLRIKGPLQDPLLRKAIDLCISREDMIQDNHINGIIAHCFFPSISLNVIQSQSDEYNVAAILAESSSYNGEELTLYTYEMPSNERNAYWLKERLFQIGVKVKVVILPINQLSDPHVIMKADMIAAGEVLGAIADVSLIEMFTDRNGFIYNHLHDDYRKYVDHFVSLCKKDERIENRLEYLYQLQVILQENRSYLCLYHVKQTLKHSNSLSGIMLNAWGKVDYKNIWIRNFQEKGAF